MMKTYTVEQLREMFPEEAMRENWERLPEIRALSAEQREALWRARVATLAESLRQLSTLKWAASDEEDSA